MPGNGGDDHVVITMRVGKEMFGERSAGAPFTIYAYGKEYKTRNYAVKAGDQLRDGFALTDFENGHYHISCVWSEWLFPGLYGSQGRPAGGIYISRMKYDPGRKADRAYPIEDDQCGEYEPLCGEDPG